MTETVFVATDLDGQTVEVGSAYFTRRNNVTTTAFRYGEEYLARPGAYTIDPSMPLLVRVPDHTGPTATLAKNRLLGGDPQH